MNERKTLETDSNANIFKLFNSQMELKAFKNAIKINQRRG